MSEKECEEKISKQSIDEETLEKLAVEELMREAVQGAARAEVHGPSGWIKGPRNKPNKRFLVNTLRNTESSNRYHYSKSRSSDKYSSKRDTLSESFKRKDKAKKSY